MKQKLTQLSQAFSSLKAQIKTKLQTDKKSLSETQTKLNESQHKLELQLRENSENEQVLEQLLKEFEELGKEINN